MDSIYYYSFLSRFSPNQSSFQLIYCLAMWFPRASYVSLSLPPCSAWSVLFLFFCVILFVLVTGSHKHAFCFVVSSFIFYLFLYCSKFVLAAEERVYIPTESSFHFSLAVSLEPMPIYIFLRISPLLCINLYLFILDISCIFIAKSNCVVRSFCSPL